jgi:hypothetical protein
LIKSGACLKSIDLSIQLSQQHTARGDRRQFGPQ